MPAHLRDRPNPAAGCSCLSPTTSTHTGLLAEQESGDNAPALSVSELSGALKRTVESAFGLVRVRGEISGWKRHASGHCYFTLKDEAACIDAVIWKGQAARLAFRPEDGAEVIATGKLTTYPGRSKYQIVVNRMELAGEGALMALLDKRRRALAAEGLFDEAKKRQLPFLPRVIGVVTSPTGAVIRDILHRLEDRCPTHVIVWPVPVQGEGRRKRSRRRSAGLPRSSPRPDLLIVARGGGSIEDLWAFNEEEVVRAAADSPIPLISAVGHETDTTLIDFASDRRAPTPTAAAEMAVPVRAELAALLAELEHRMSACVTRTAARAAERLGPDSVALARGGQPVRAICAAARRCRRTAAAGADAAHRPRSRRPGGGRAAAAGAAAHRASRAGAGTAGVAVAAGRTGASRSGRCSAVSSGSPTGQEKPSSMPPTPAQRRGRPSFCRWPGRRPCRRRGGADRIPPGEAG